MPIFEYHCFECGDRFEQLTLGTQKPDVECSGCGSKAVERVFSTFAAHSSTANGGAGECRSETPGVCSMGDACCMN